MREQFWYLSKMNRPLITLIGGVGGSGTRLVAKILNMSGFYSGDNLNNSMDCLNWPGNVNLMKDRSNSFKYKLESLQGPFSMFFQNQIANAGNKKIAIKVPGSFYYLPLILNIYENIQYIHVVRHGLDMAFSQNKNQLRNWGVFFNLDKLEDIEEVRQFRYWHLANKLALDTCNKLIPNDFIVVRYEDLCQEGEITIDKILKFVKIQPEKKLIASIMNEIRLTNNIGRYKSKISNIHFDERSILFLKMIGYQV